MHNPLSPPQVTTSALIAAVRQFCYISHDVAHDLFIDLLPAAWAMMEAEQQRFCAVQARRFIASGIHVGQTEIQPTPLSTFTQALMLCEGFAATVPFPVFHVSWGRDQRKIFGRCTLVQCLFFRIFYVHCM